MLDLHLPEKGRSFRHQVKVVLEKTRLKHSRKIFGNLITFVEAGFQVISDFGDIWNIVILLVLIFLLGKLELDFITQQKLQEKVHDLGILL